MEQSEDVTQFLENVTPARRHSDAQVLNALFQQVTGWYPRLWRGGILGYGYYAYTYASGRSGSYLATGFAPRAARLSVHILPGYAEFTDIRACLGKHKAGKSCFYINRLEDVDLDVLRSLIRAGVANLATQWPVTPT